LLLLSILCTLGQTTEWRKRRIWDPWQQSKLGYIRLQHINTHRLFKLFNFQGLRHWQTVRHATESIIIRIDWWPSAVNQSWLHETYLGSQVPEKGTVIGISALNLSSTHPHVSKADSFKISKAKRLANRTTCNRSQRTRQSIGTSWTVTLPHHSWLYEKLLKNWRKGNIGCLGSAIEVIKSGQSKILGSSRPFQKPTAAIFECQGLARFMMCNKICSSLIRVVVVRCCESWFTWFARKKGKMRRLMDILAYSSCMGNTHPASPTTSS